MLSSFFPVPDRCGISPRVKVDDTANEPTDTSVYAIAWSIPVAIAGPDVNEKSQHSSSNNTATCDKTFHHFYALMKASGTVNLDILSQNGTMIFHD